MLKIRLSRVGKNNTPIFRLVVAEKTRAVKREYIEILGLYKPTDKENKFQCKKDRVEFWISKGAQPSETVNNLLCDFGVLPKDQRLKIVHGKNKKKKDLKKEDAGEQKAPAELKPEETTENDDTKDESNDVKDEVVAEVADNTEKVIEKDDSPDSK